MKSELMIKDIADLHIDSLLAEIVPKQASVGICILDDSEDESALIRHLEGLAVEWGEESEIVVTAERPVRRFEEIQRFGHRFGELWVLEVPKGTSSVDASQRGRRLLRAPRSCSGSCADPTSVILERARQSDSGADDDRGTGYQDAQISVIVSTYEQPETVPLILESLYVDGVAVEVIIADDGSRSSFHGSLVSALKRSPVPMFYVWQTNRGFRVAASRNNGLRVAVSPRVLFLDGDTVLLPGSLRRHTHRHQGTGRGLILIGNRLVLDEDSFDRVAQEPDPLWRLGGEASRSIPEDDVKVRVAQFERYRFHPWRVGFTCNLSVSGAESVRFDENIRSRFGSEDLEYCYRLWRRSSEVEVDMALDAVHRGGKISYAKNMTVASHEELVLHIETLLYVIGKHRDEPFMWAFLDAVKWLELEENGRWRVNTGLHQGILQGLAQYLSWRDRSLEEAQAICRDAHSSAGIRISARAPE